jgi:large subunit ribosomal protein L17
MHRHAYNQRKLSLAAGPRRALVRGLIDSLILYERVETTEAKAKTIAPQFERLVTKAKKGDLHNYRQIMSVTLSPIAAQKLRYELADNFKSREGGYTRIIKTGVRRGDGAPMAVIELVLDQKATTEPSAAKADKAETKPAKAKEAATEGAKK